MKYRNDKRPDIKEQELPAVPPGITCIAGHTQRSHRPCKTFGIYGDKYAKHRAAIILEVFEIMTITGMVDQDENIADVPAFSVQNYIRYFEGAYLVFHPDRFSFNHREQINAPKKMYAIGIYFKSKGNLKIIRQDLQDRQDTRQH